MPEWFGWCYVPDWMDYAEVEGYGGGRYYDSQSQVHDLGRFQVNRGHVTILRGTPNSAHVTWELIALEEDGEPMDGVNEWGFHTKLYHWYDVDPASWTYSFNSGNWQHVVRAAEFEGMLRDDVVDADSELKPYSEELMTTICTELQEVNTDGS